MSYFYKVYGLNIESEMLIPELSVLENENIDDIHVKISYKNMDQEIRDKINSGINADYQKQKMWFNIKNLAAYSICNGNEVNIDVYENADKQIVKVYILGSVLGMVLLQRNIVAIHGGSIIINDEGYIFTGDKGAGKSTLTTALRKKGYKFIADDVAAIRNSDVNMINPGFAYQKLCEDTMVKLGYDTSKYEPFRSDMSIKYIVPAIESFVDYEVPCHGIFEIKAKDVDSVKIEEITGNKKIKKIIKNIFRIEMLMYSGGPDPKYFSKCVDIAKNTKYYKITRPKDKFTVDEQIGLIENIVFNSGHIVLDNLDVAAE